MWGPGWAWQACPVRASVSGACSTLCRPIVCSIKPMAGGELGCSWSTINVVNLFAHEVLVA
jgi:hypothetical protein